MADQVVHIVVRIPHGCDADDTAQFAIDALTSWGGQLHPDDPLFHSLRVKAIYTATKKFIIDDKERDLAIAPQISRATSPFAREAE